MFIQCSDFDLHNLSYTISPSVDYHSFSPYHYSSKNFHTPAYSYMSENFLHSLNSNNNNSISLKPSHSSLTYSPVIDRQRSNDKDYLSKLSKRKQLFVNKSEMMQCNLSSSKMSPSTKLSKSTFFDPESLVSFTLQSNVKKSNSKSTPCLNQQPQTSPLIDNDKIDSPTKTPKSKRKSTINWPFKRSNSSSTVKQNSTIVPFSIQQHTSKTVSMLHKKLLSKSQSNLKNSSSKSPKTTLSIMSNVTLKRSSNKKQTIKLFGQSINKLCLGDRHLIAPVKNMLIELMQRAPQTIGIFRKSANAVTCRELKAELEQNPDCDLRRYPISVIASVFKELLRSLPDSVLVGKMYQKWLEAAKLIDNSISSSDCTAFIRPLIKSLPKANYLLLQHFLCILHYIAMQSSENKMNAENLAVCIGPSLLHHDVAPASMHCELSKEVPKLISYLIKNCSELFGANTLTLFEAYQNILNENKENEMKENKDSGAEESDSLNSLNELNNNNLNHCKISNDLNMKQSKDNHLHYQPQSSLSTNTFSSFNSTNLKPKIYLQTTETNNNNSSKSPTSSSASISSTNNTNNTMHNSHRLASPDNGGHQSYYHVPMLSQQTPYTVNKVSLSNLSRDSGLTLSDTQLYSPEEDDEEDLSDYHHIINQHLHLNKKLNSIESDAKCLSNKSQFKINSANKSNNNNSTSLKKKCNNNKINRLNATSSEEDDLEDIVDIDELSEKSCASDNCTSLYSRVYDKNSNSDQLLTKSAPQLVNIDTIDAIDQSAKQIIINHDKSNLTKLDPNSNKMNTEPISCTTIPLYLNSIKKNSISIDSPTDSSCNSPSSSNLSSTSLNLSSSNEYSSPSDLQRNYFSSITPPIEHHQLASTPITINSNDQFKNKQPHIVTISAKGNSLFQINTTQANLAPTNVCNVSINQKSSINLPIQYATTNQLLTNNQKTTKLNSQSKINQLVPPTYEETMNRKEMNARMANLIQPNTSRKISDSEIDNLISKKIYEQSLRVYNADLHKDLTIRAVPAHVKSQSSDSESDCDQYPKRKITNESNTIKLASKPIYQIESHNVAYSTPLRIKPIIQQRCAKDQTEYWKKDINLSVAKLRNKFTELCKQNECSTLNRKNLSQKSTESKNSCKSISSIYDLCKADSKIVDKQAIKPPINKLRSGQSSSQLSDKNCVIRTIIQVNHGKDKSTDSLSGEESYV